MNKILDYTEQVMNHHKNGQARGKELGFHSLKELITFKPKYTTYILGFPRAGKTEIHLEILFNLTERYGDRHALMSPEIGGVEDVIAELISKHLKKNFFKSAANYAATEKEISQAMNYLSEYFYVLDNDDKDYDLDMFFEDCVKIEIDNKIKLNTTSIDPWNDLEENLDKYGGREDKYLAASLRKVRYKAKKHDWHNFIVTHAKDMPSIELKGVTKEKVTWHNVVIWGALADVAARYLHKGDNVYLEGEMDNRSYEKDGVTKYISEVNATQMVMLGGKYAASGGGNQGEAAWDPDQPKATSTSAPVDDSDTLPF